MTGPLMPDGIGLDPVSAEIAAERGSTVHLRLSHDGRYPVTACLDRFALGQLWSGKSSEVTCPGCLEVVHA